MADTQLKITIAVFVVVAGIKLITDVFRALISDYRRRNTVEFRRKGSSESVTISIEGSKQDAKKLVDYLDRHPA